jgi:hypothetical protein
MNGVIAVGVQVALLMVNATVVLAVRLPEVPLIVTVDVPTVAELLAVSVSTLDAVVGFVENDAVTPIGRPEAARVTLPLNPPAPVTVIGDSKYRRHCGDQNPSKRGPVPMQVWRA